MIKIVQVLKQNRACAVLSGSRAIGATFPCNSQGGSSIDVPSSTLRIPGCASGYHVTAGLRTASTVHGRFHTTAMRRSVHCKMRYVKWLLLVSLLVNAVLAFWLTTMCTVPSLVAQRRYDSRDGKRHYKL